MNLYTLIVFIVVFIVPISLFLGSPDNVKSIAHLLAEVFQVRTKERNAARKAAKLGGKEEKKD